MLNELNKSQKEAVIYQGGPQLVIAGAGSGKTRVLTYKIAYLIQKGIPPYRILALTFTNKAADEMKKRIDQLLGYNVSKELFMGTFHSVFNRFLRLEAELLGFKSNFSIYDAQDSKSLISSLIKEMNLNDEYYKAKNIQTRISQAKNKLMTPEAYAQNSALLTEDRECRIERFSELYQNYVNRCKAFNAMDFDDLLVYTNILFKKHPDILEKYRNRFDYVLVDEYQDTNFAQYLIVNRLSEKHKNVCVVGDDAQSIYSFRGAQIKNILNFEKDYPDYNLFKLEQNYRSTQTIVNAANSVIAKNKDQIQKKLFSKNAEGSKIFVKQITVSTVEGYFVAERINEMSFTNHYRNSDFAVLYRTNAQSRIIEEALRKYNIPYKVFGGLSFYQRKEIKDAMAYLRLVVNNYDAEAIRRVINYPSRKIGDVTMGRVFSFASNTNIQIWELIKKPHMYNIGINQTTQSKLKDFADMISEFSEKIYKTPAHEIALAILNKSGLMSELYTDKTPEGVSRYENIQEFLNGIKVFSENHSKENLEEIPLLTEYLENIALITDFEEKDNQNNKDFVSLMTIHSAKGLEFKNVFIVGVEENLFPNTMSTYSLSDLEEERRLFYVAMTRAEHNLVLSFSDNRWKFGQMEPTNPSRFLNDIDPQYLNYPKAKSKISDFSNESEKYEKPYNKAGNHKRRDFSKKIPEINSNLISVNDIKNTQIKSPQSDLSKFVIGTKVRHNSFGEGKIISISGEDENKKAVIFFSDAGNKTILLKYAKLELM